MLSSEFFKFILFRRFDCCASSSESPARHGSLNLRIVESRSANRNQNEVTIALPSGFQSVQEVVLRIAALRFLIQIDSGRKTSEIGSQVGHFWRSGVAERKICRRLEPIDERVNILLRDKVLERLSLHVLSVCELTVESGALYW